MKHLTHQPLWGKRGYTITFLAPFFRQIVVQDGWVALLFRKGKFERVLKPGKHFAFGWSLALQDIDVRECGLIIEGEEVLIGDQ